MREEFYLSSSWQMAPNWRYHLGAFRSAVFRIYCLFLIEFIAYFDRALTRNPCSFTPAPTTISLLLCNYCCYVEATASSSSSPSSSSSSSYKQLSITSNNKNNNINEHHYHRYHCFSQYYRLGSSIRTSIHHSIQTAVNGTIGDGLHYSSEFITISIIITAFLVIIIIMNTAIIINIVTMMRTVLWLNSFISNPSFIIPVKQDPPRIICHWFSMARIFGFHCKQSKAE